MDGHGISVSSEAGAAPVAPSEIHRANLEPPRGRRPVGVPTRKALNPGLHAVAWVTIACTVRGLTAEGEVGGDESLPSPVSSIATTS